jgi:mRNA-degrading endonuclease toxin of MazEF toxin-antitoxin module
MKVIRRGEIYLIKQEDKSILSTAVVISNNVQNKNSSRVLVLPISRKCDIIYRFEIEININNAPHKVMCDQIRQVPRHILTGKLGEVTPEEMQSIEYGVRLTLGLDT